MSPSVVQADAAYQRGDFAAARKLYREAIAHGDATAAFKLGSMVSFGEGGQSDPAEAARLFSLAAESGHGIAHYNLAAMYAHGRGVPQDYQNALRHYELAHEANTPGDNGDAAFMAGVMYANGQGARVNFPHAKAWWEMSATLDHPRAKLYLARLLSDKTIGLRDVVQSARWFIKAWQANLPDESGPELIELVPELQQSQFAANAEALHALGFIHKFLLGEHEAAVKYLVQAGKQNHAEALRLLGYMLDNGEGVAADSTTAARIFRKAADLGDSWAQFNLASMLQSGKGVAVDLDGAIEWYRRAAEGGREEAELPLVHALAERSRNHADIRECVIRLHVLARRGAEDEEFKIVAPNGKWGVIITERGGVTALSGITLDELDGEG